VVLIFFQQHLSKSPRHPKSSSVHVLGCAVLREPERQPYREGVILGIRAANEQHVTRRCAIGGLRDEIDLVSAVEADAEGFLFRDAIHLRNGM
jgi:hypothetical protein